MLVEAEDPPGCLRTVAFAAGSARDAALLADLDAGRPVTVEGVLALLYHPARGEFPEVVELRLRDAVRVRAP